MPHAHPTFEFPRSNQPAMMKRKVRTDFATTSPSKMHLHHAPSRKAIRQYPGDTADSNIESSLQNLDWDYRRLHHFSPMRPLSRTSLSKAPTPPNISRRRQSVTRLRHHRRVSSNGHSLVRQASVVRLQTPPPPPRQSSRNWRTDSDSSITPTRRPAPRSGPRGPALHSATSSWSTVATTSTTSSTPSYKSRPSSIYKAPSSTLTRSDSATSLISLPQSLAGHIRARQSTHLAALPEALTPIASHTEFATTPVFTPSLLSSELAHFDSKLRPRHLTRLVFWYLYYDLIEPPSSPSEWYDKIPAWELSGWIKMGRLLAKDTEICSPEPESDEEVGTALKGLRSICRTTGIPVATVRDILIRIAGGPPTMTHTETKAIVDALRDQAVDDRAIARAIRAKLEKDRLLLERVQVEGEKCGELWPYMRYVLLRRVQDYLGYVVGPALDEGREARGRRESRRESRDAAVGVMKSYWRMMEERGVPRQWYW